jgi:alkylation response protein AidB-like acyl-CoA dehydrogenase
VRDSDNNAIIDVEAMDFEDTAEEAAFRADARAWLDRHARRRATQSPAQRSRWRDPSPESQAAHVTACQAWQRLLFEEGWAGITWPVAYGGRGGTSSQQMIFNQEQAQFEVESGSLTVGLSMVAPTLIAWGTETQKERFLPPMLRGDELWCQLFSEPGAGSDLAGIMTRAEHDGDAWIVNGQKVWTSLAHHSQWAILLVRTNSAAPKHQGITYMLLDMTSSGVDVRPLRQIDRVAHFNEVFLTEVRIPDSQVVGQVDGGWKVAQTTLQSERVAIGAGEGVRFDDLRALAEKTSDKDRLRDAIAATYIRLELLRYLGLRVQTAIRHGRQPGPESSVMKLAYSRHVAATADLVLALEGPAGMLGVGVAPDGGFWQQQFLSQWSVRIGGGTDQIQRNIISERVLGMPREPRPHEPPSSAAERPR